MPGLSDYNTRGLDLDHLDDDASEYSWGPGLVPKGREHASPAEGGRYHGRQATVDDPPERTVTVSRDRRI